ncbi:hypothetical protein [Amnibacterium sp.]|uniref:hypothetical protein n=1 Tax=Amnibacterium sp. TaxID=1872496 RepID=UPI00262EA534|nr:hypothetical protein [Amnibacterium sp.]MCU1472654.1 hypothetical protein [Amnibacterium sp.]
MTLGLGLAALALAFGAPIAAGADELPAPAAGSSSDPGTNSGTASADPAPAVTDAPPTGSPAATDSPTPTPKPPLPFAIVLPAAPVLTLPNGDGLRDSLTVHLTAPSTSPVTLTAVRGTRTVLIARSAPLAGVPGGGSAAIRVPITSLTVGSWTLHASTAGHSVAAPHPVRVGSGIVRTLTLSTDRTTYYPKTPGAPSRVGATVRAADETGASIAVHGSATIAAGTVIHRSPISRADPGTARLTVSGLRGTSAALSARVAGPAGSARSVRRSVTLAPTVITRATVSSTWPTVQPVIDDQLDTVTLSAGASASSGVTVPVHGEIRVSRNGTVVRSWSLTTSATHRVLWDGRVGGRIVVGTYTVTVRERGPDGGTVTRTTNVAVSADHLPYRIRIVAVLGSGNEQGLAIGRVDGATRLFAGVDVGGGDARIDEYDLTGRHLASSAPLPVGHAAEIAVGDDGLLYVANGSATAPTRIGVVDPNGWTLKRTIDAGALGVNGMIASNPAGGFLVFANLPGQPFTVTPMTGDGSLGTSVPVPDPGGLPQGLEVVHGQWWVYSSLTQGNRITKIDPATGNRIDTIELAIPGEGEGEAIDPATGLVYVGCHSPDRFGVLEPVTPG